MDLGKVLAEMRANGVSEAQYEERDGCITLKVAFGNEPLALKSRDGEIVSLDVGMSVLERDPLGEEDDTTRPEGPADVAADANFKKPVNDAAG